ncbi:hypothetical protein ALI144C_03635 [Actinosynnema sp. ALI-1.44]|uniref:iron chaperone n=1 Tax=Actinosynnema sp. ALI-1.44 TaxID=1933779 RepID=UPI00097BEA82|nr:DUF1801 domain-containing protein [Actinosynnema sp. ALI-1.44]ONI90122.1 hypothetical protein ALI144C_03635 [Actinosynnema sp. ALI-1.44]
MRMDKQAAALRDVLAKIDEMPDHERAMAERIHVIVTENIPEVVPKLMYGMPAYALNGKVVCFFQAASKFKTRYSTFGFEEQATLDDGAMWPTSFALTEMTAEVADRITSLVRKAVS